MFARIAAHSGAWDIVVVGGGATGVGVAIDAASRGYEVLLLEQHDFGKGTSSRSTKLVHGGVRYLEQGNVALVMEALKERGLLRRNAPHIVRDLAFVVPNYEWWEAPFYGLGLKMYNLLAGKYGFGKSEILSKDETLARLPTIKREGLRGGVVYYDGQFDDARLLVNMVTTAHEQGAALLNYAQVTGLHANGDGLIDALTFREVESDRECRVSARVVVNATGAFSDNVRRLADPGARAMIAPSQGVHLVFERSFLPGDTAILVPHTSDGRVLFAIPWRDHTLVGTTDTPIESPALEPRALEHEIDFILDTAANYLARAPTRADVLSVFAGIRPLIKHGEGKQTSALSRDQSAHIDKNGLLSIAGGKWTTYRNMAQGCVDQAAMLAQLPEVECKTRALNIHGWHPHAEKFGTLAVYGTDATAIREIARRDPALAEPLHPRLLTIGAEIVWHARAEMARTVEDVLARRARALFLDARAAIESAPRAAEILARELGRDAAWRDAQVESFRKTALAYLPAPQG
ncbi:MAG: glycerol-3-phosphate dehydrogenase/oxidase [Planctomycetes bacterium]|nr:glycerol-3-phosphate dehydrogenase/oxidase [Planctomycetota bacterium]